MTLRGCKALAKKKAKKSVKKKKTGSKPAASGGKKPANRKKVKKKKKKPAKPANANKYQRSFKAVALKITSEGGGVGDIAVACGVTARAVYYWLKSRPSFAEAFAHGEQLFEDNAEALYRRSVIAQATPHNVVSVKTKEVEVTVVDKNGDLDGVPGIETETLTKKGRYDIKPLADFMRRRRPDRYAEKRVIGATDEIAEFMDWCAGRDGGDNDGSKD